MARTHAEAQEWRRTLGEYAKEHGTKATMEKFQANYEAVRRGLLEVGSSPWEANKRQRAYSGAEALLVAREANENGIASAMAEFDMSEEEVKRRCRIAGLSWKKPSARKDKTLRIIAGLLQGKAQYVVADELEVSRQYVNEVKHTAEKAGIQFPGAKDEHAVSGE